MQKRKKKSKLIIGWREWIALPELGIPAIKAKIDTGARTSTLHAYDIESYLEDGQERVRFAVQPLQRRRDIGIFCTADVIDQRFVTDSGGHRERRYVISTPMLLGTLRRQIEITLSNREVMRFRMLLGRTSLKNTFVTPSASFLLGHGLANEYKNLERSVRPIKKPKRKKSNL